MRIHGDGFTLVELLVVMGIIGILMGITVPMVGNAIRRTKEERCRNNLRQLYAASVSYANDHGYLPAAAGGYERTDPRHGESYKFVDIEENEGWAGKAGNAGRGDAAKANIENGALFQYMNESLSHYVCPVARSIVRANLGIDFNGSDNIYRTYAMNGQFGSDKNPIRSDDPRRLLFYSGREENATGMLLFSEVPPESIGYSGESADCSFDPEDRDQEYKSAREKLGGVHTSYIKGKLTSLAVFLDGHIEKIFPEYIKPDGKSNGNNSLYFLCHGLSPELDRKPAGN